MPYVLYGTYSTFSLRLPFQKSCLCQHLDTDKSTHSLSSGVDVVGGFHIVKTLVLCKLGTEPVCRHGFSHIVLAPQLVGFVQSLEADISLRLQKLNDIVAAALDRFHVLNSCKSAKEVIAEYAAEQNCTEETAAEYLTLARQNRRRVPFYSTMQDEDSEETGEDVTCDDSWNYADILWKVFEQKKCKPLLTNSVIRNRIFLKDAMRFA